VVKISIFFSFNISILNSLGILHVRFLNSSHWLWCRLYEATKHKIGKTTEKTEETGILNQVGGGGGGGGDYHVKRSGILVTLTQSLLDKMLLFISAVKVPVWFELEKRITNLKKCCLSVLKWYLLGVL